MKPKIPRKYQPKGYEILYEDRDLLVGNKAAGYTSVPAAWNRGDSIQDALDTYVRKGNSRSRNCVFAVHRLDQATTGVLIFAKSERAQFVLKENWATTIKTYYAVVHGKLQEKSGLLISHLQQDEEYFVRSSEDGEGKLARTEYSVLAESENFTLLKIGLLTGRKNQIRVHFAELGHPLVGDAKYGSPDTRHKNLALHAGSLMFSHPHSGARLSFSAPVPEIFHKLVRFDYKALIDLPSAP